MEPLTALELFLSHALLQRSNRYISFVQKSKSRSKFLDTIYHKLEEDLDPKYFVDSLPVDILSSPGYLFEPPQMFGSKIVNLSDIANSHAESCLAISASGLSGIYCPETYIDSRKYILLST